MVPVGKDQAAHLEFRARCPSVQRRYGDTFEAMRAYRIAHLLGTDGVKKMSK